MDFEHIAGMNAWARAKMFQAYTDDQTAEDQFNNRLPVSPGLKDISDKMPGAGSIDDLTRTASANIQN